MAGNVPHRLAPFMVLVAATAGCLTGAMPGIRTEVVDRMQAAFAGTTPVDVALDEAEKAGTDKITAYREQVGQ